MDQTACAINRSVSMLEHKNPPAESVGTPLEEIAT